MSITKEIRRIQKIKRDLENTPPSSRTPKMQDRIDTCNRELAELDKKSPGIVAHLALDARQSERIKGKKGRQQAIALCERLCAHAVRTKDSGDTRIIKPDTARSLNQAGFGLGDLTLISLMEHKFVKKLNGGGLLLLRHQYTKDTPATEAENPRKSKLSPEQKKANAFAEKWDTRCGRRLPGNIKLNLAQTAMLLWRIEATKTKKGLGFAVAKWERLGFLLGKCEKAVRNRDQSSFGYNTKILKTIFGECSHYWGDLKAELMEQNELKNNSSEPPAHPV